MNRILARLIGSLVFVSGILATCAAGAAATIQEEITYSGIFTGGFAQDRSFEGSFSSTFYSDHLDDNVRPISHLSIPSLDITFGINFGNEGNWDSLLRPTGFYVDTYGPSTPFPVPIGLIVLSASANTPLDLSQSTDLTINDFNDIQLRISDYPDTDNPIPLLLTSLTFHLQVTEPPPVVIVPEPSSIALIGVAIAAMGWARRRTPNLSRR